MLITIKGIQTVEGESDSTDFFTQGSLYVKNDSIYIVYNESELTGYKNSITTLKIKGKDKISMIRNGESRSHLAMELECKQIGYYGTPFGQLIIGIYANAIKSDITESGGSLYCKYSLDINSSEISTNELFIDVKPA